MAKNDVSGNSVASALAYQKQLVRQAEQLWRFDSLWQSYSEQGWELTQMRVVFPGVYGGEFKVVIKASQGGQAVVAFHNAASFIEAVVGALSRLENRSLKFREDKYAGG